MKKLIHSAIVVILAVLTTMPASAQWSPDATADLGMGYGRMALSQSILSGTRRISTGRNHDGKSKKAEATPTDKSFANPLAFRWDAAFSQQYKQARVERESPDKRAALNTLLTRLDPPRTYRKIAYSYGLNPFSIPDLIVTYDVASWELVTGRKASHANISQMRDVIYHDMKNSPSTMDTLRNASPQDMQRWQETQAYAIVLERAAYTGMEQAHDADNLQKFRARLISNFKAGGVDIASMKLE